MDICVGIAERRLLSFYYDGLPRVVAPAAHGQQRRTGNPVLRGYIVRGATRSNPANPWRPFLLRKISGLTLLDESFEVPPGYERNDQDIFPLHCQL